MPASKTQKKKPPVRRNDEVNFDRRISQTIPCELDRRGVKRVSPWKKDKAIESEGIYRVVASANEEIRLNDILTLFGLAGVVQNAVREGKAEISTFREAGSRETSFVSVVMPASQFCRAAAGDNDLQDFLGTIDRLTSYNCTYYHSSGSRANARYLYKYVYDAEAQEISVVLSKSLLTYVEKNGWITNVNKLRAEISSSPARALYMFLSQQPGNEFLVDKMITRLSFNYTSPREARRALKSALNELVKTGYLISFVFSGDKFSIVRKNNNEIGVL